jgi:hypothetical protein
MTTKLDQANDILTDAIRAIEELYGEDGIPVDDLIELEDMFCGAVVKIKEIE